VGEAGAGNGSRSRERREADLKRRGAEWGQRDTSAKMRIFEKLVRNFIFDLKFLSETERA
jgi:hypothetical protein